MFHLFCLLSAITYTGPSVAVLSRLPNTFVNRATGSTAGSSLPIAVCDPHRHMMVTTFHPELTSDIRWHQQFVNLVRDDVIKRREKEKGNDIDIDIDMESLGMAEPAAAWSFDR